MKETYTSGLSCRSCVSVETAWYTIGRITSSLGLTPTLDVLVDAALLVLLLREPDEMQPVETSSRDDLFCVNHQCCPFMSLSVVSDCFKHRHHLHQRGSKNG